MAKKLTYSASGVDIDEGTRFVELIKPLAARTRREGVVGGVGGFGSLFSGRFPGLKDPVLVSSTDGVGTKLKLAFLAGRHDTVGVDLVAMCVNDIIVNGAEPLFFLDYLATGRLDARKAQEVVKGIARGLREANSALAGGETAEMPGFYRPGEYDLAGFAVGVVDRKKIIDGSKVAQGDRIIGLKSSGLHSNGFSLARKVLLKKHPSALKNKPRGLKKTIGEELLTPTRIYVRPVLKTIKRCRVHAMAHITGGGLIENIPRVLPRGVKAVIDLNSWKVPPIFELIQKRGNVDQLEMLKTFNCGIGFVLIVPARSEKNVLRTLKASGERPLVIGRIERKTRGSVTLHQPAIEFAGL
jgi:phosphoribosylformylglycinamidine cyclo-ligase